MKKSADTSPIGWMTTAGVVVFCLIMLFIPWQQLWGGNFVDRSVYLNKFALFLSKPYRTFSGSVMAFITNEVLWDMSVKWCAETLHVPLETIFGVVSFLCLFVFSKYLASRHGLVSLLLLINPLIVEFAFSQMRMAMAVSLLMLAMFWRGRRALVIALAALACCVHTAAFLILFIYFSAITLTPWIASRASRGFYCWLGLVAIGAAVVLVIGPFRAGILSAVGDRRANYDNVAQGLKYASFWILLLLATAAQGKKYFESEGNAIAVAFLAVFVFASFLNVYNARFLSAAYPMIISALLTLSAETRMIALPGYCLYAGVQWFYWLGAGTGQ